MTMTFQLESQSLVLKHCLLLNPIEKVTIFSPNLIHFPLKVPKFHSLHSLSDQTQIRNSIVCGRKRRMASGFKKFMKFLPKLIPSMASNLKMLQEPLNLIIAEMGCGDGGGNSGFWKGFGGNDDGWRRRGNTNSLLVFGGFAIYGLGWLLFGRDLKHETLYGVMALGFFVSILIKGLKRGVKDWILDLCLVSALMGWRLKREDVQKWVEKVRVNSPPLMELVKGKRSRRRIM